MSITHSDELKQVYLLTFDGFGITPGDIVDATDGTINNRFARELLSTLTEANLLTVTDGEDGDVWQVANPGTYDTHTREEAEDVILAWLGEYPGKENDMKVPAAAKKTTAKKATPKEKTYHPCYCGCKENVPSTSFYRPGHDARHAGQIGREIAANIATKGFDRRELLNNLPSDKLQAKAELIAEKAIEREAKKSLPKTVDGTTKVGKNEVVARRAKDGSVEYLDAKGNWKSASKAATAAFVADE